MVATTDQPALAVALDLCDSVRDLLESGARDPEKVRRILQGIKDESVPGKRIPFKNRSPNEQWERAYKIVCGKKVDCAGIEMPTKPDFACWPIIVVPQVGLNALFTGMRSKFSCWSYCGDDLEKAMDWKQEERDGRNNPYGIWVRAMVEATEDLNNVSANAVKDCGLKTTTLHERLCLEAFYWIVSGGKKQEKHLDPIGWTLCSGSRDSDGYVPSVYWCGGEVRVDWAFRGGAGPDVGARQVVTL